MAYNIIFYFSDQQRWDTCGCFGQPLNVTPNLDKLAEEGVKFDNAFSPQPVCGPCRALFQTGKYPTETGCFRNNLMLPSNIKTLGEYMEKDAGCIMDIEEAERTASEDVVAQREEALAKQLSEMKRRKKKLVDPLQFEMSIQAEDLSGYVPAFGWEMAPPSDKQKQTLEKLGILPDAIENAGKASKILDRLDKRRREGLTTPKQIRFLESRGFQHVGTWQFETAKNMIDRIAGNGWRVPNGINPAEYRG